MASSFLCSYAHLVARGRERGGEQTVAGRRTRCGGGSTAA